MKLSSFKHALDELRHQTNFDLNYNNILETRKEMLAMIEDRPRYPFTNMSYSATLSLVDAYYDLKELILAVENSGTLYTSVVIEKDQYDPQN